MQKLGHNFVVNSRGAQGFQGQLSGQNLHPTRRGVVWNQDGGLRTTGVIRNHHQNGGGETVAAGAGHTAPLQLSLGVYGAQEKNNKNVTKLGNQS